MLVPILHDINVCHNTAEINHIKCDDPVYCKTISEAKVSQNVLSNNLFIFICSIPKISLMCHTRW